MHRRICPTSCQLVGPLTLNPEQGRHMPANIPDVYGQLDRCYRQFFRRVTKLGNLIQIGKFVSDVCGQVVRPSSTLSQITNILNREHTRRGMHLWASWWVRWTWPTAFNTFDWEVLFWEIRRSRRGWWWVGGLTWRDEHFTWGQISISFAKDVSFWVLCGVLLALTVRFHAATGVNFGGNRCWAGEAMLR
jgi:hypothetical protein